MHRTWSSLWAAFSSSSRTILKMSTPIENASLAKSLKPPTIANVPAHQGCADLLSSLDLQGAAGVPALPDVPGRLQAYATEHSLRPTVHQAALQRQTEQLPRAIMAGAPDEANLLCLLLEVLDAHVVVEVGVFRGLTTLAMAECLHQMMCNSDEQRKIYGLDMSKEFAKVGQAAWKDAGVEDLIDFRIGDAKQSMDTLLTELGPNSVDLVFIDADKSAYDSYYEKSLQLVRPEGLIVVDNTLWAGSVAIPDNVLEAALTKAGDSNQPDLVERVQDIMAIKAINAKISQDDRVSRVSFLTIADGVTICRKK